MPKLVFRVASDWEEVVKLRNEIAKLKQELKGMDSTQSPADFKTLNTQLAASTQRMNELVTNAAKAGAEMETGFKRKIFAASQSVNGFTEKIIAQKAVVKDVEADVKRLGDAYRTALKRNPLSANSKLAEYTSAKKALDEEKSALFGLTQEQANARLSVKKLRDEYSLYKDDAKGITEVNNGITISWKQALGVIGGAAMLKSLVSDITHVRMEIDSVEKSFAALLKSEDKAKEMIGGLKELSIKSGLNTYGTAQTLLGFNVDAEKILPTLKSIGDITMGNNEKFSSMTLAFAQMSAAGRLMGQDLNQMINAGFNPLQVISEKTGKSIAVLKKEMEQGAISSEMVADAFATATAEGGRFYNMLEKQNTGIRGEKNRQSAVIKEKLNEIGEANEKIIAGSYRVTTFLIENYETIGKILVGLVATYGTYRTAVMLVTAADSKHTLVEIGLTNARILARKAQLALNAAMLTNPYVLLAVAVGGLATAMWAMSDSTTAAARAQKEYNDIKDTASKKEQKHKQKIEELLTAARDESLATLTRQKSLEELRKEYPKIFGQYDIEKLKLEDILKLKQQINEEDSNRSVQGRKDDYTSLKQMVANQRRYLQLFDNPELRKNMSDADMQIWKMFAGKQSYVQVREQMGKNSELLKKYQKDVLDDNISAYKANLKNYSKERLEAELKMAQSSASKRNGFNVDGMMVKGGDLESIISSINGALSEKKSPNTYKQDYEEAKKDWEDAQKDLSEIEKDKSKFTSKQYEEAKKRKDTAEKAYKDLGGITGSSLSKQENQSEKLRQQTEKYNLLLNKQALEQQRFAEDLQMKVDESRIKAMNEGSKKTIAQMELNFEKEMQAIDRQKEDALRKKIEDARSAFESNPKNKGKSFDATGIELSDDENKYFDELYKAAIANNEKAYSELANQYLSYTDQRLAIEKKFNDDVALLQEARKRDEAKGDTDEVAKIDRSIGKRTETKNEDVFKLDAEQFKKSMNWEQVFGNLDKVSTDTLKKLKSNLKDFISAQKDLSPENLKELVDAIERIDDKVSERNPFEAMSTSFKSLKTATDAEREAQEAYNKALKEDTDEEKKNAKATLESAKNNKQKALSEATTALHKGVDEIGRYVEAGNQVIGIMETLGVKTPEWLEGAMSGFGEMLNGLEKMDLTKPMSIVTGGLQTIKGALTSVVSLGGLIPGFGGADYSRYNKMKEEYDTLVDVWDTLISKKQQYIDISYGDEARKVGQETLDLLDKKAKSNVTLGLERLNAGASIGSHSIGVRQRKGMSKEGWDELRKAAQSIGFDYNSVADGRMTGLFDLTADQLSELQDEAPTFWAKLDGDVQEYLQNVIDCNTEIESMKDKLNETMTGVSFDSFYDSFISTLSDMDKSSKDMADDFGEYLKTAILSNLVANKYRDKIEALYNDWASKSDSDDDGIFDLTAEESEQLKAAQRALAEQMMAERDAMANAFGWNSGKYSQSSSKGGFQAMSQDTGSELNGRFTALQMAGEEIKSQNALQSQSLNILTMKADAILSVNTETRNIADDTRDLIANSYLELVQISENTGAIVKPIQQIQKDIAEVKKNTSKL